MESGIPPIAGGWKDPADIWEGDSEALVVGGGGGGGGGEEFFGEFGAGTAAAVEEDYCMCVGGGWRVGCVVLGRTF